MTCQRFHTVSRMRENCTYGSMRGRTYPAGASRPTLHPLRSRPLVWNSSTFSTSCYTHDGNKNVSEIVASSGDISAHYEYAPFGAWVLSVGDYASDNPWRFSSEFADDDMTMVYYNFRHYDPNVGRWIARDPLEYLFP